MKGYVKIMPLSPDDVLQALRAVQDPDLGRDIVTLGFVKDLEISPEGDVSFSVELTTPACPVKDELHAQAEAVVRALPGVRDVNVTMTAQVRSREPGADALLPGVRQVVAIASGKGGVGKSTVTVNLAIALAQQGARVGIMDADVYGPSIPLMMGCLGEPPMTRESKIIPIPRYNVKLMSLGFLLAPGQSVLWRGPMVAGTVRQLLADVDWGDLDYLLVDLPPGTGDAPMSLAQLVPLTGVVVVTTPQAVAGNIAVKSIELFARLNTPILGVVENMGAMICPSCGSETRLFGGLAGESLAQQFEVPFLGSIPFEPAVSAASDQGMPSMIAEPDRPPAAAFRAIAGQVAAQASVVTLARSAEPVA